MQVEIVNRNLFEDPRARQRMRAKVHRVVDHLSRHVRRVTLKVEALAARAGGGSQECLVLVALRDGGTVVVRKRGEGVLGLTYHALRQARDAVLRRISKRRSR